MPICIFFLCDFFLELYAENKKINQLNFIRKAGFNWNEVTCGSGNGEIASENSKLELFIISSCSRTFCKYVHYVKTQCVKDFYEFLSQL